MTGAWAALRAVGPLALVLLLAIGGDLYALGALDLRDVPGPASARLVHGAIDLDAAHTWTGAALHWLIGATGLDALTVARILTLTAVSAAALGAALGAWAMCGWASAASAALLTSTWSFSAWMAVMVSEDALAWGLGWLGVGVAWAAARAGWPGLALGGLGGAAAGAAVSVKAVALPALGFLPMAPLLVRRSPLRAAALIGAIAGGALWGRAALPSGSVGPASSIKGLGLEAARDGLALIRDFPARGMPEGVFEDLAALALIGALVPGARSGRRQALWIATFIGLTLTAWNADSNNNRVYPRHLIAASYGLMVLGGCALGQIARWLRPLGPLRWAPAVAVGGLLTLDAVAFLRAWDALRVEHIGASPTTLPAPPEAWGRRYDRAAPTHVFDTSEVGMIEGVRLALEAPEGGLATIQLRDDRDAHLQMGAALAGRPSLVMHADSCCPGGPELRGCAAEVLGALDEAGALVILPWPTDGRIGNGVGVWADALRVEAKAFRAWEREGIWITWRGEGEGGPLPCGPDWGR